MIGVSRTNIFTSTLRHHTRPVALRLDVCRLADRFALRDPALRTLDVSLAVVPLNELHDGCRHDKDGENKRKDPDDSFRDAFPGIRRINIHFQTTIFHVRRHLLSYSCFDWPYYALFNAYKGQPKLPLLCQRSFPGGGVASTKNQTIIA